MRVKELKIYYHYIYIYIYIYIINFEFFNQVFEKKINIHLYL